MNLTISLKQLGRLSADDWKDFYITKLESQPMENFNFPQGSLFTSYTSYITHIKKITNAPFYHLQPQITQPKNPIPRPRKENK